MAVVGKVVRSNKG